MKHYTYRLVLSAVFLFSPVILQADEPGDSIDIYQNQTVSNTVVLQGRTILTLANITVSSTGSLTASSPDGIVISGTLNVQLGGELELNGGQQFRIRYTYDASGNRTRRKHE